MAKYEDYAKQTDELNDEIENAGEAQAERATVDIPESVLKRFEGKSQEEVLTSYANLERKLSQQGQAHGDLRRSFDEYVMLQSQKSEPEPEPEPVTADDLYEDPDNAVARVVARETGDKLKELEEELVAVRRERAVTEFERRRPNAQALAQEEGFVEWVQSSPYRIRLAQQADKFDLDAAEELFGLYEDSTHSQSEAQKAVQRDTDLRHATLESTSPEMHESDTTFSRAEVIDYKLRSKLGDMQAKVWLDKNAEELAIAYEEGRVID